MSGDNAISATSRAVAQDAPQNDDVTALIVRYTPVRGG